MDRHKLQQLDNQVGELLRHGSPSCVRMARNIMAENFGCILRFALRITEPKPKPEHTIADNYPAGGLTLAEPCMFCEDYSELEAKYDALLASHTKALERIIGMCGEPVITNCKCGRPTGLGAIVSCAMKALSEAEKL